MGSQVYVYTKQMGIDVHRGRLHKCPSKTRTEIAFREEDNEGVFYCDVNETNCDMIWKYVGEMKLKDVGRHQGIRTCGRTPSWIGVDIRRGRLQQRPIEMGFREGAFIWT